MEEVGGVTNSTLPIGVIGNAVFYGSHFAGFGGVVQVVVVRKVAQSALVVGVATQTSLVAGLHGKLNCYVANE